MMPGRGEQAGIIWGGEIYEGTERQIRDFSESVRDRQLFRGSRGIKLHTVRHQSDDGWIGGRTGSPAVCQSKKGVILTDNGARLIPYIQEMVNQKAKLRQAAFNINHKIEGKLRVGSFSSITALWMPGVIHFFKEHYPKVQVEIFDGNYDEIRDWIIHGQVDCGFLSSIVADDLKFYPLMDDPLCAVMPKGHPLTEKERVTLPELFAYPLIIETPGCDNDIQHLLAKCPVKPKITYSFRDDTLIMAFVKSGLGVTISQEMVLKAFARDDVESRPLEPASHRTLGLAFSKTANSVVSGIMLEYLKKMTG